MAVNQDLQSVIDNILHLEILAALPPPSIPGASFQPRGGNLSFYRPQSEWLSDPRMTVLHFAEYDTRLRDVVGWFGGDGASMEIPQINAAVAPHRVLSVDETEIAQSFYHSDLAA
jgi:hypothetical protein